MKWYSLDNIKSKKCQYNIIFGERSNGKTYSVLKEILLNYHDKGKQGALIRRFEDDIKLNKLSTIFNHIIKNGEIKKIFKKEGWTGIVYKNRCFYLSKKVQVEKKKRDMIIDEKVIDERPFMYAFALTEEEDYKENAFPDITIIFFDEFLTRKFYLPDEFITFENIISTIKRKRQDVTIYMCGNTINQFCPYFREMGLKHIRQMKQNTIDVYNYGDSDLRVAVEYAESLTKTKKDVDCYFAFDNPKLKMITHGEWELDIYPHCPIKYLPKDIRFIYFIKYEEFLLQCEVIQQENNYFTYIHRKTSELKNTKKDIIFDRDNYVGINRRTKISKPFDELGKKIWWFFLAEKVYYQDNEVGEMIRNYLLWCNGISD